MGKCTELHVPIMGNWLTPQWRLQRWPNGLPYSWFGTRALFCSDASAVSKAVAWTPGNVPFPLCRLNWSHIPTSCSWTWGFIVLYGVLGAVGCSAGHGFHTENASENVNIQVPTIRPLKPNNLLFCESVMPHQLTWTALLQPSGEEAPLSSVI